MAEYIDREILDSELYNRFHDEDEPNNITDVRLGSVRNFVREFPTADVVERSEYKKLVAEGFLKDCESCEMHLRSKIDKAIAEMKSLADPENTILGFDEKMGLMIAMNILVRNIGKEVEE